MVRLRLRRVGRKKQPSFRLVATDREAPRDGRFLEVIGFYNPRTEPSTIKLQEDRIYAWLSKGAQPSDSVDRIFKQVGLWDRFERFKAGEDVEKLVKEAEEGEAARNVDGRTRRDSPVKSTKAAPAPEKAEAKKEEVKEEPKEKAPAEEPAPAEPAAEEKAAKETEAKAEEPAAEAEPVKEKAKAEAKADDKPEAEKETPPEKPKTKAKAKTKTKAETKTKSKTKAKTKTKSKTKSKEGKSAKTDSKSDKDADTKAKK